MDFKARVRLLLSTDIVVLTCRMVLIYLILAACRIVFYIFNREIIGPVAYSELGGVLRGSLVFDTASLLYANLFFIFISLLPIRLRERGWYRGVMFVVFVVTNSIVVMTNMADTVYFRYTLKRFTAEEIFFANNDNSIPLMLNFLGQYWYLVLIMLALIGCVVCGYRRKIVPRTPIKNNYAYFGVNLLILLCVGYLSVGAIRGGFSRQTRPITLSNATAYNPSPSKANLVLSNPFCIVRTMGNQSIRVREYFPPDTLAKIFTPYHNIGSAKIHTNAPPLQNMKGRNVVIFIMESFSAEHSALLNPDLYPTSKGYTPFLDSLMRDGLTFTSAYSNGRKSIDALPSVLASIPSFKTPFVLLPQSLAEGDQLPKILSQEGYKTLFFNGSSRNSMGFGAYVAQAGVQKQYSREDFDSRHGTGEYDGNWGIWDEPFMGYMGEVLSDTKQPFMSTIFTLTSHHPFVVPIAYKDKLPRGTTKAHQPVSYADLSVRKFFEKYGSSSWFANTIFVFVGDHVSSETFAPKSKTPTGNSHIISFIYTPDQAIKAMNGSVTQQIDIMPTLLGLLGYQKPYFAFGRDVLGEPERRGFAINYYNQSFQGITDSLVLFFDEQRVMKVYARADELQERDILSNNSAAQDDAERQVKAFIQQYYTHVSQKRYIVEQE